ncbi:MAG: class I SAM-dependent methyltransferase [Bacteroidota bacterium]
MSKLPYLNLGCGITFHKEWTNVDFASFAPEVKAHNLLNGIPFGDNQFRVVYHSHVLEHFPKQKAPGFIRECYRVLQPGGIIRVAIPDLEKIANNYIKFLHESLENKTGAAEKYEWTMLEMYDQVVRSSSGGEMVNYIRDAKKNNDEFLLERNGWEVKQLMEALRENSPSGSLSQSYTFFKRVKSVPKTIKNKMISALLGKNDMELLRIARFRAGGEIHQWMYDRYSLGKLLSDTGFSEVKVKTAFESEIPEWESFRLDGDNGVVRKPDSLFMEARK